jgi:RNA polymerase sigma-70 factor (ECF subfamily)
MAMLLVLETLTPTERAVFVLRDVFDFPYGEIAEAVGKTPAAVRQIAHRARSHVAARRPRDAVSSDETRAALQAFQHAVETGDVQSLVDVLAPDVVLLSDAGGRRQALPRPVVGADKVARVLSAGLRWIRTETELSFEPVQVNGWPGLIIRFGGETDTVMAARVENGLITGLYFVRNPEKLSRMDQRTALSR